MIALALYQALAEYVGAVIRGIPGAVKGATNAVTKAAAEHPITIVAIVLGLLVAWAYLGRRRSR